MAVSGLHHINIRTSDLEMTQRFYEDVVGLSVGPRPPFRGAGVWLYADDHPWVHVSMADKGGDEGTDRDAGFGHIAFYTSGMKALIDRVVGRGIDYQLRASPDNRLAQLFFTDPNGVELEFTCPMAEAEAEGVTVPDRD